ncbi:peptide ABC transporter substrate-binding protein [Paenactinomyces guangxiensis]|uniref:Peptide ABC transporter substrate-binding protein n=1 Tax=Paenactinomyces guangxiensis TaxID=1490290 RepID=A0A7W2A829_9BACL|nr:peptide ABC transporter substrate-binding protein [Paenactinomyces guangxiensis]MBA4493729.1 peptide ABC transporter substrate-binding protein [Paenactinomyces guangxiensis]MBH8591017.1 peptide ABC transporter substrate-binding protein [Paenactinomyces guangxiensis]
MSKRLKFSSLLAILLVASLVLSACNFSGDSGGASGKQVLNLTDTAEPPNLDSAKSTDVASFTILNNTMEGLYRPDKDDKPILGMAAEEPKISEDKKTYTFKIRDAQWSDGKPVTAHDFEYAWKRALDPKTASEYAYILYPVLNAEKFNTGKGSRDEVGVKALDDKTLEVKLEQPIPYFKDLLSFPTYMPQRQDIVEKFGDKYALEAKNLVFNGPFILSDWKHEKSFQYKKNDKYWDKSTVKLAEVNVNIVKDNATSVNLYKTKKVDYSPLGSDFIDAYKGKPDVFTIPELSSWYLELNQTKPLFKNKKIRQAIAMAIDKKTLTESVLKNGSVPANGIVPPETQANDKQKFSEVTQANVEYNPQKAKQLFQEGLKELGMTSPGKVELLTQDTSQAKKDAEFFKEQLRVNLGLDVSITAVPFKERLQRSKDGKFDIVYSGWGADYNDPMTFLDIFITGSSYNRGKWSNSEYDALIKKSQSNPNFEERLQDLIKAEKIFIDDAGVVPLYYRSRLALKQPYIKDWPWHLKGPEYSLKWAHIEGK